MTVTKHYPTIKYTSRDFNSIKNDLVDYAKRYYPDTYQDFNEAGFGALMLDTVSYIGDILSFYVDYSANESFLDTAIEYENVLKLGKQLGYKATSNPSSFGIANFYVIVPANVNGIGPDRKYFPFLRKGTQLSSIENVNFLLNEDVSFGDSSNEVVVSSVNNSTGLPTHYAIKASGQVISGYMDEEIVTVGEFEKFRKIELGGENITEIVSVTDSEGNSYIEVDYLSQDVVFSSVKNYGSNNSKNPSLLKPFLVPRRFVVDKNQNIVVLQFGAGNERDTTTDSLSDPSTLITKFYGKKFVSDFSFDPTNLLATDTLGISPSNTTLTIAYRSNTDADVNISSNSLITILVPMVDFDNILELNPSTMQEVVNSMEVSNDEPINGDITLPSTDEVKLRIYDNFATQRRAVTELDYRSMVYAMPPQFGAIKKTAIMRDPDSFKRNLNIYVISENREGALETTNSTIKNNLQTWLNQSRMINDTIDILDAKIVNIGINFTIVGDQETNKFTILNRAITELTNFYQNKLEIGEPFLITEVYSLLNIVDGVVDTTSVNIVKKDRGNYSPVQFNLEDSISADGRYINTPNNVILEIKFPSVDIQGSIK